MKSPQSKARLVCVECQIQVDANVLVLLEQVACMLQSHCIKARSAELSLERDGKSLTMHTSTIEEAILTSFHQHATSALDSSGSLNIQEVLRSDLIHYKKFF